MTEMKSKKKKEKTPSPIPELVFNYTAYEGRFFTAFDFLVKS